MKCLYLAVALCCANCFAEDLSRLTTEELGVEVRAERLTDREYEAVDRLNSLGSKSSLSQAEVTFVTNSLAASKSTIAEAALLVITVHDMPMPFHSDRVLAEIIVNGRKKGQSPANFLKRDSYTNDITHFTINGNTHKLDDWGYMFINEKLGRIAAVYFAREMRQGKDVQFNENEYAFLRYDKLLLEYAKYPASEVPKMIISALVDVTTLTTHEYDLVRVLVSYDDINLDLILSTLKKENLGKYAKLILLEILRRKMHDFGNADREKIRLALNDYDYDDDMQRFDELRHWLQQKEQPEK